MVDLCNANYTKGKPPRCKKCLFPNQDDPSRFMVSFENPESGNLAFAIKCPNMMTPFGRGCSTTYEPETAVSLNLVEKK